MKVFASVEMKVKITMNEKASHNIFKTVFESVLIYMKTPLGFLDAPRVCIHTHLSSNFSSPNLDS